MKAVIKAAYGTVHSESNPLADRLDQGFARKVSKKQNISLQIYSCCTLRQLALHIIWDPSSKFRSALCKIVHTRQECIMRLWQAVHSCRIRGHAWTYN